MKTKRTLAVAVAAVAIVTALWFGIRARSADRQATPRTSMPQAWYTIDDGKTWFAEVADKPVPFEHQGKQAYRCYVWTCDGGKTTFVSHLERLSPQAQKQFQGQTETLPMDLFPGSTEVRPPLSGEKAWLSADSPAGQALQNPRCPDGKGGVPVALPAGKI